MRALLRSLRGVLVLWMLLQSAPGRAQNVDLDAAFDADDESPEYETESESEPGSESESEAGSESDSVAESDSESDSGPAPGVSVQIAVGGGFGTREFVRPTLLGVQRLETATFPAADVALAVRAWPADAFSLEFLLRYQSSLGFRVQERPFFALPTELSARAERVEVTIAPTFRFGDSATSVALGLPLGFGMRTFWPEASEFRTPGYSLAGPQLRAELIIPFSTSFALRIGPEVLVALAMDDVLLDQGVSSPAVAVGGEAMLHWQLGAVLGIELAYRESHAFASTTLTTALFSDVERFGVVRLTGSL